METQGFRDFPESAYGRELVTPVHLIHQVVPALFDCITGLLEE